MGPLFLGAVIAFAVTCNGAILQENPRVKREEVSGEKVKTFKLDGVLIQLNLNDAAQPWNGGKISVIIEDLQKYFQTSPMTWAKIDLEMESSKLIAKYTFEHGHTKDYELGEIKVVKSGGDHGSPYRLLFKTTTGPSDSPVLIVPKEISEMALEFTTDIPSFTRNMKSTIFYINEYKNRNIEVNININPFKSIKFEITNGDDAHNIEIKLLTSFGDIEDFFSLKITGSLFGENIVGAMKWNKEEEKLTFNIDDLIKGDSIIKMESGLDINVEYEISKYKMKGSLYVKYEDDTVQLRYNALSSHTNSLTIKVVPGQSLDIKEEYLNPPGKGITVMTYKTKRTTKRTADVEELSLDTAMTLDAKSKLFWILSPLFDEKLSERVSEIRIFVDKKNSVRFSPKFRIEAKVLMGGGEVAKLLADTTVNPYMFKICHQDLFMRLRLHQNCIDATVDHQLGHSLDVDVDVLGGLHLGAKVENKDKTGRDMSILVKKGDVEILKL